MKVGVIGAGTMGQGIAKAFAQTEGYEVALCDIKQEWADGGKDKIAKGYARLVEKGKMDQAKVDEIVGKITSGLKEVAHACSLIFCLEAVTEKLLFYYYSLIHIYLKTFVYSLLAVTYSDRSLSCDACCHLVCCCHKSILCRNNCLACLIDLS